MTTRVSTAKRKSKPSRPVAKRASRNVAKRRGPVVLNTPRVADNLETPKVRVLVFEDSFDIPSDDRQPSPSVGKYEYIRFDRPGPHKRRRAVIALVIVAVGIAGGVWFSWNIAAVQERWHNLMEVIVR